ncbi:flagellar motor switch protein FliN [Advenella sp. RU8]|uniref:flagellar motor switch protein FliN n=1 Tax=Advenella sp. RU8 TaxID=3399575 RepID=UPI003AADF4BD
MSNTTPSEDINQDDLASEWEKAMAEQATASAEPTAASIFESFDPEPPAAEVHPDFSFIKDIPVQLSVELGRARLPIKDILKLGQGSIVELNAQAGEPMDVLINGMLIAQGEIVSVNGNYGVRLTDIITPAERLNRLNRPFNRR